MHMDFILIFQHNITILHFIYIFLFDLLKPQIFFFITITLTTLHTIEGKVVKIEILERNGKPFTKSDRKNGT